MQKNKWLVFLGLATAVMMVDIDMTVVNLAIADITQELDLNISSDR